MNEINIEVSFVSGQCYVTGINLVTNDYNSTKCLFTFDKDTGTKIFKMKNPKNEVVLIKDIIDNEITLVGENEDGKQVSIFTMAGDYPFEIAMYDNDGRLTSASNVLSVVEEQVKVEDSEELVVYKPLFDELLESASFVLAKASETLEVAEGASQTANEAAQTAEEAANTIDELISQADEALGEMEYSLREIDNLNVDSQQLDTGASITITKKDGTTKTTMVYNGKDGKDGAEYDDSEIKQEIAQVKQNFANYYLKTETYSKEEVNTLIGNIEKVTMNFVGELPVIGESNVIYFVPSEDEEQGNVYDEYVYANGSWEKIGSTKIDLSNYYNKDEINALLTNKQDIVQYTEMPAASEDNLGNIIQYIGETTDDYINGYFYGCVDNDGAYSWENVEVQESSGDNSDSAKFLADSSIFVPLPSPSTGIEPYGADVAALKRGWNKNLLGNINHLATVLKNTNKTVAIGIANANSYISIYKFQMNTSGRYGDLFIYSIGNATYYIDSSSLDLFYYSTLYLIDNGDGTYSVGLTSTKPITTSNYPNAQVTAKPNRSLKTYTGYDVTKTQTLKNINGTLTWVDDE